MKERLLFSLIMSAMMAFTMSFVMTSINVGFIDTFLLLWARGFCIGLVVAFPTSLIAAPIARKIINKKSSKVEVG